MNTEELFAKISKERDEEEGGKRGWGYGTIVADPPWPETNGGQMWLPHKDRMVGGGTEVIEWDYRLMTLRDIKDMGTWVGELGRAEGSHLYLWATQRSVRDAFEVMELWGYDYKSMLTWCKRGLGMGFQYFRHSAEFVLFGVKRGTEGIEGVRTLNNSTGTWFMGIKGRHSEKPKEFFQMVEASSPGPRLELFNRGGRDGWDVWGDQSEIVSTAQDLCLPVNVSRETLPLRQPF